MMPKQPTGREYLEKAAKVRSWLAQHPGSTADEIYASVDGSFGVIQFLQKKRLIRFERGGKKGKAIWFVIPQ